MSEAENWAPKRIWLQREQGEMASHTWCEDSVGYDMIEEVGYVRADVAQELLAVLQEYVAAEEMTKYGDTSDFVWPKIEMRKPGETAWGWVCEKHGLGYQSGCICCHDEYLAHKERKDSSARYARDDALHDACKKARAAISKATGA
jgi:hypothetical protein